MNILVTGGLGVNGCWVTRSLMEQGHRPVVFDNRPDFSLVPDIADRIQFVPGDILDFPRISKTLKDYKIDRICHLAALYPDPADANPVMGFQVNALATVYILEAARLMDVDRVVYTSSYAAFSPLRPEQGYPTYERVTEDHPSYPLHGGVYGATKVASELMGHVYKNLYGLDFVALRFAAIYGPGKRDPRHGQYGFIWTQMVENAMVGIPTYLTRGGDEQQDMTYARDVAHSVVLGALAPKEKLRHQLFHIGSGTGHTIRDFAAAVKEVYPEAVIEVGPGNDPRGVGKGLYCIFDLSRAREELGYEPQFTLSAAVRDWVSWMGKLGIEARGHPTASAVPS